MKFIGIDPGIARTGWGLIESSGRSYKSYKFDCITTEPNLSVDTRLARIYRDISKIIKNNQPDEAAIEKLFFNTNAKTAMQVGQARGVAILAFNLHKIPIFHYTPLQIKVAMTGYGRADKRQIQIMVKTILKLDEIPKPDDVSDALATALTHAFTKKTINIQQKSINKEQ